ncbi:unnamed protein product [Vitrella brassicaformis CCMP3155]|uniref:HORMA domain-containing protein n=1 Tax=Vitrella brassicaformis (strain CCMP3155) TaxID=1169540 RepID=A0A0G4GI17_VITBC|nr:unnamed protein product [Vitrella brassicaformis CCMP3155]|eukprot:CEM29398.1 unnamed protein product [Vitrella brassicaformis CCMP3155]
MLSARASRASPTSAISSPRTASRRRPSLSELPLKILRPKDEHSEAAKLHAWLEEGVFDAIDKKCLRMLIFGIHDSLTDALLESYHFKFAYDNGVSVDVERDNGHPQAQPSASASVVRQQATGAHSGGVSKEEAKKQTTSMLQNLIFLTHDRYLTMKMMYYDERMSATYEPKHFRPFIPTDPSNPSAHYNEIPLECACGGIDTQHHQMTLKVKTACDDGIHAIQQPHPHASHHGDIHGDHNDQQGQHEEANDHGQQQPAADDDAAMAPVDALDDGQQLSVLGEIRAFCERHNECEYLGELVCADFLVKRGNSRYYLSNPRTSTDNPNEAPQTTAQQQQPHTDAHAQADAEQRDDQPAPQPNNDDDPSLDYEAEALLTTATKRLLDSDVRYVTCVSLAAMIGQDEEIAQCIIEQLQESGLLSTRDYMGKGFSVRRHKYNDSQQQQVSRKRGRAAVDDDKSSHSENDKKGRQSISSPAIRQRADGLSKRPRRTLPMLK